MDLGRYPNDGAVVSRANNPYRMGGKFLCEDGYVIILPVQNNQWLGLAHFLGDPDWTQGEMCKDEFARAENAEEIHRRITEIFSTMKKDEVYHRGQAFGVPVSPVADVSEVLASPQLQAREFFVPVEHPDYGTVKLPSLPYVFEDTDKHEYRPAPSVGQDNNEIFSDLLGLTKEEIIELEKGWC
jgi:crotonobetainyl-CoA:carnitine CoA-transferase CaiB-like acyl-CoA transferase